ncbi:hypothetical protein FACS1894169_13330 [Bacteroidia bacterium]|nr:hypothetical protein FACS1894169_13330 [Bacteroidia bacterium]
MDLIKELERKLFKFNVKISIDYHAGGFFVKKEVIYIYIHIDKVYFLHREENGSPRDSNYEFIVEQIELKLKEENMEVYSILQPDKNLNVLELLSDQKELFCVPSIFMENIEGNISEIAVDNLKGNIQIYNHVYSVPR